MKALPKRKGNWCPRPRHRQMRCRLNESPSEKEGKFSWWGLFPKVDFASMKALPKRKGNREPALLTGTASPASMKALPKRKGNRTLYQWNVAASELPQ